MRQLVIWVSGGYTEIPLDGICLDRDCMAGVFPVCAFQTKKATGTLNVGLHSYLAFSSEHRHCTNSSALEVNDWTAICVHRFTSACLVFQALSTFCHLNAHRHLWV